MIPLEDLRSVSCKPGLMNRQNSYITYGNATIIPATILTHKCVVNCPAMRVLSNSKGILSKQNKLPPQVPLNQQKKRYVGKSGLRGPKIITSNTIFLNMKATILTKVMAIDARIRCHLNSSRWSKKLMSFFSLALIFFAILRYLLGRANLIKKPIVVWFN